MCMIKNLLEVASKGKLNILWMLLQTEKERIDFVKNHTLYMN